LALRNAAIDLQSPQRLRTPAQALWAVYVVETQPPLGQEATEWLLLATVQTATREDACERLQWYAARWQIEVFHRILKSGCCLEDRCLADALSLQACLALDLVVAWRVMILVKMGLEVPEITCTFFCAEAEWQALGCYHHYTNYPASKLAQPGRGAAVGGEVRRLPRPQGRWPSGTYGGVARPRPPKIPLFHPQLPAGP
ncbi:MAG: hypothetical protein WAT23_17060, partial [Chromatiaceae bacterium]